MIIASQEIFNQLFPREKVMEKRAGFLYSNLVKKNILLGKLPFSLEIEFEPAQKCDVIIGEEHILVDGRQMTAMNLSYFRILLIAIAFLILVYMVISKSLLFLVVSIVASWPIPFVIHYTMTTAVFGGSSTYLLKREWIEKMEFQPDLLVEGKIPAGEPYILSQYLAKNNIKIPNLRSGRAAWLGSEYPRPFVETNFKIKILQNLSQSKSYTYLFLLIGLVVAWISIHAIFIVTQLFERLSTF